MIIPESIVWVFTGASNLGKSYLAHKMGDLKIFETDSCDDINLIDQIDADIVVLGNKHKYSFDMIQSKISTVSPKALVRVDFS